MHFRLMLGSVAALVAPWALGEVPPAAATLTAVHCGHLIDAQAGKLLGETTVVVDGRRIRDVIAGRSAPPGATEIVTTREVP